MKKFELTKETKLFEGRILHRIRAVRNLGCIRGAGRVMAGCLGGWVEKEFNLCQYDSAWICNEACVYDEARVLDDAVVYDCASVSGSALIFDQAVVSGSAKVCESATVCGNAQVTERATVRGCCNVCDHALISGDAIVKDNAEVGGGAEIVADAVVGDNNPYMAFNNVWSSKRWFTYTFSNKKWKVGCFLGSSQELVKKSYKDSAISGVCYGSIVAAINRIKVGLATERS